MSLLLDDLDRKIVYYLSQGVHSYNDLSKLSNVGRNTIYRRIDKLEEIGIISRRIMAIPNFEKLNLSAIIVGINIKSQTFEKAIAFLKKQDYIKFLWRTYGTHDVVFMMLCDKGNEGRCIYHLKSALENLNIDVINFDTSTSFSWEKIELSPFKVDATI